MSDGHTTGIWIPEDDDVLERFDERFGEGERSARIRAAMELYLAVDETLGELPWRIDAERDRRAYVRQAVLDIAEREGEE